MSAAAFDNLVTDLRADYVGQPRDGRGQFASTLGLLRSPSTVETVPETENSGGGRSGRTGAAARKLLGGAASIAVGLGAGLVAATLYEQLKPTAPVVAGENNPPEAEAPMPGPVKEAPKPTGDAPRKSQDERLQDILSQLTKDPPESRVETPESKKLGETLKEYAEQKAKPYRKPRPTTDAMQSVIDELLLDWKESAHPRDKTGRFAIKGSGGGSRLLSAAAPGESVAVVGNPGAGGKPPSDGLDDLTIRDLKELARKNQVTGYSVMTKVELAQGVRAAKANPNQQKRIRETLIKKAAARKAVGNTPAAKFLREWGKMTKILDSAGVNPVVAALAMGGWMTLQGKKRWESERKEYQTHIADSAVDAANRARTIPVEDLSDKPNVVFAVGGYKGMGSTGEKIINEFTSEDNQDSDWFRENANFVAIENNEYDVKPKLPRLLPGGKNNPAYLAESLLKSGGNMLKQRGRKRNEQAVELAANLYAHAIARGGESGQKRVNEYLPITIVTHGAGGATVDEALAILRSGKMKLPDAAGGTDFLNQIQVIKLGSTNIGLADPPTTDKRPLSSRTFTSSKDPYSVLPKTNETWKSEVPGGDIEDYMRTESIRDEMLYAMGYDASTYKSKKTSAEVKRREKEKKERFQGIEDKRKAQAKAPTPAPAKSATPTPTPTPTASRPPPPSPKKIPAKKTKAQLVAEGKAGQPKKAGYTWVPKPGYAGKDGGPKDGYFRKATPKKKTDSAFDLVISHLLEV